MSDFSEDEMATLALIAGLIIPASAAHGVPGADDPAILSDICASAARDRKAVSTALSAFEASETAEAFRAAHPAAAARLQALVALCYYRDPRVLRALGAPARAPFPRGYDVSAGDAALIDQVRARGPIWRKPE